MIEIEVALAVLNPELAAEKIVSLRSLVGELADVVADQREKLIDHTNLYDPRWDGDEPDAQVVALIAKAKEQVK